MVRVGTLRQRDQLTPKQQNWFRSARTWVTELASIPRTKKALSLEVSESAAAIDFQSIICI